MHCFTFAFTLIHDSLVKRISRLTEKSTWKHFSVIASVVRQSKTSAILCFELLHCEALLLFCSTYNTTQTIRYWDEHSFVDQIVKASLHTEVHTNCTMYCMIKSTITTAA